MEAELYYTAPDQDDFDDMKAAAMEIWSSYEDPYKTEKLDRIKDVQNIKDNFMYLFAMFDIHNQRRVVQLLKHKTCDALRARMLDGGNDEMYLRTVGL